MKITQMLNCCSSAQISDIPNDKEDILRYFSKGLGRQALVAILYRSAQVAVKTFQSLGFKQVGKTRSGMIMVKSCSVREGYDGIRPKRIKRRK